MKYVVISPKSKMICFDDAQHVAEYCMEKDNFYLDKYCNEQQLEYENMTPVEIGYAYTVVGAEASGCRVFETEDILEAMRDEAVEEELIEETRELFDAHRRRQEIDCPGYIQDIASLVSPVPTSSLSGNAYSGQNIDGASRYRQNSGI